MDAEKDFLPKELIDIFDSLEYEENGYLEINSFDFIDDDAFFKFLLIIKDAELRESQLWQVKIENYRNFNIKFDNIDDYFTFYTDHIALKQYEKPSYELYFKSLGSNPERLYVDIIKLHRDVFNDFVSTKYINTDLLMLYNAKSGLFARGAKSILEYYYDILQKLGKEPYFYKPNIIDEQDESKNNLYKLISLGSIFFIGTNFIFKRLK